MNAAWRPPAGSPQPPVTNGPTSRTPAIEPTYPSAVPMPESLPRSAGKASSGSIALYGGRASW